MKRLLTLIVVAIAGLAAAAPSDFEVLLKVVKKYTTNVDTPGKVVCACQEPGQNLGQIGFLRDQVRPCSPGSDLQCLYGYCQVESFNENAEDVGSYGCDAFVVFAK